MNHSDFQQKFCAARDAEAKGYYIPQGLSPGQIEKLLTNGMMGLSGEFIAGADWAIKFLMQSSEMAYVKTALRSLESSYDKTYGDANMHRRNLANKALATIRAMGDSDEV